MCWVLLAVGQSSESKSASTTMDIRPELVQVRYSVRAHVQPTPRRGALPWEWGQPEGFLEEEASVLNPKSQRGEVRQARGLKRHVKTLQKLQSTRQDEVTPSSPTWLLTRHPLSFLSWEGSLTRTHGLWTEQLLTPSFLLSLQLYRCRWAGGRAGGVLS